MADQSTQHVMYDKELTRRRKSALSTLARIEKRTAEIRRDLESGDGSVAMAVGAAQNTASDITELVTSLVRLQTLEDWRFLVTDESKENGRG